MCVVAKVLERCVYNCLIGHIENMISVAQHGFLRGKSCTGQLISVLHYKIAIFKLCLLLFLEILLSIVKIVIK
jgi:hypothetical protein